MGSGGWGGFEMVGLFFSEKINMVLPSGAKNVADTATLSEKRCAAVVNVKRNEKQERSRSSLLSVIYRFCIN